MKPKQGRAVTHAIPRTGADGLVLLGLLASLCSLDAGAAPIRIDDSSQVFFEFTGPNPLRRPEGYRLLYSAKVSDEASPGTPPPGSSEDPATSRTRVSATSTADPGVRVDLPFVPSPAIANEFATGIAIADVDLEPVGPPSFTDAVLQGGWILRASNDLGTVDVVERVNPPLGDQEPIALATDATLSGDGTLSWILPTLRPLPEPGAFYRLSVDIIGAPGTALAGRIITQSVRRSVSPEQAGERFAINLKDPDTFINGAPLEVGDAVVARIRVEHRNNSRSDAIGPIGRQVNRSATFLSFTVQDDDVGTVFVPTVDADGVFNFDVAVDPGVPIILDPVVTVGYDFAIAPGDPLFASVRFLTDVGGAIDLFLFDGSGFVFERALALGEVFSFGAGVERFRLAGIDESLGLDPLDPTAFQAEVTFASAGRFTGTMTPLTATVQEPASVLLLGLACLAMRIRRQADAVRRLMRATGPAVAMLA